MLYIMQEYIDKVYELPSIDKFTRINRDTAIENSDVKIQQLLVEVFKDFGVEVFPADIYRGPRKTRIEFYLARGVRISVCKRLEPDLVLQLRIPNLKVVAPVPGKSTIAVDISRDETDTLPIGNGLALYDKYEENGKIRGFLGLNIEGYPVCIDFNDSPHLILQGTTGTGKSITLQGILMSLLLKYNPSQLSVFLASAYGASFPVFDKIPHLYGSIAHSVGRLKYNLELLKKEIEKRLQLFKTTKTTNFSTYNALLAENKHKLAQKTDKLNPVCSASNLEDRLAFLKTRIKDLLYINKINKTGLALLPKIVCIIDDVNELMPIKDTRMYQLLTYILRQGPEVGISVIMATQTSNFTKAYPDLLSNVNHRAVFFSPTEADSKRILDVQGASELPSCGVCLYQAADEAVQEIQTCNVTHSDCVTIASHWARYSNSR